MKSTFAAVVALSLGWCAGASHAADIKQIEAALKHEIITPATATAEVQRYCDDRVPKMGRYQTVAQWQTEADRLRAELLSKVIFRGEAAKWRDIPAKVEWLDTIPGGPGYRIRKLRFEAVPGMWIPALIYEPDNLVGKVPVIMNVNGHSGAIGKAEGQKQMRCINQARRGMIAMNVEWIGMGQLNTLGFAHTRMNQLDLCGTAGIAPFFLSMKHGLDVLLSLEHADPTRVGVTGLSGGGWQTIFISSLDTRVKFATPVAGYSSFRTRAYHFQDLGDPEQTPCDLATVADYAHLTAMMAPRATLLVFNAKDNCCFQSGYALPPLLDAARPIFELYGKGDSLRFHINEIPGTHNYERDNREALYHSLGDFFYKGDKNFDPVEIEPAAKELKTRDELRVDLPAHNEDFNTLALALAKKLPRLNDLPGDAAGARGWQQSAAGFLAQTVRAPQYHVHASKVGSDDAGNVKATDWKLDLDGAWTLPAVELAPEKPTQTALLICDTGRASASADAARLTAAGYRVIALDPFNMGESVVPKYGWLFCLLVSAVGDRPIGIQAGQMAAVARWAADEFKQPVTLVASGMRSTVGTLIAAALESHAISAVELHGAPGSLKELLERSEPYNGGNGMELYCFGLLELTDIKQLVAMIAPRHVTFVAPSERAKSELAPIVPWYRLLGEEFDPAK